MSITRRIKTSFTGGVASPALNARVDLEKFETMFSDSDNVFVQAHGGVANRAGFSFISPIRGFSVQLPFKADVITGEVYSLLLSDGKLMFSRLGVPILEDNITGLTYANVSGDAEITKTAHGLETGDIIYWKNTNDEDLHNRVFTAEVSDVDTFTLTYFIGGGTLSYDDVDAGGTFEVARRYTVDMPYTSTQLRDVVFVQDNDVMYMTHPDHPPKKLSRLAETNWTIEDMDFSPNATAPTNLSVVVTNGSGHDPNDEEDAYYKVSAVDSASGEESLPSSEVLASNDLNISGAKNVLSWDAVAGADRYIVYKDSDGVYGYVGATKQLSFTDDNIVEDTSDGPQEAVNPFNAPGLYPRSCTLHEQRLFMASSKDDPQAVQGSRSALLENFSSASPAKADDAITFRVRSKEKQNIFSMVSTSGGLACFTSSTEWNVTGGNEDYMTPTNTVVRPQTNRGSTTLQPLEIGEVILFKQARGGVIRDYSYSFEDDRFKGPDRTILAEHLFREFDIIDWCYAQSPYSIIWGVRADGALLSFTYVREHDIWAWAEHSSDGECESVISLPEGDEDVVYATFKRTIGGQDYRYHERMEKRRAVTQDTWFFVDAGLRYQGDPATTFYGLHHLEGKTVEVLADGFIIKDMVVQNGSLTLPRAYSNVVIGLPYDVYVETLDLDIGVVQDIGTVQGREIAVSEIWLNIEGTRGIGANIVGEDPIPLRFRDTEGWGEATEPYTGKIAVTATPDYTQGARIRVEQTNALPMTLLATMVDFHVGG